MENKKPFICYKLQRQYSGSSDGLVFLAKAMPKKVTCSNLAWMQHMHPVCLDGKDMLVALDAFHMHYVLNTVKCGTGNMLDVGSVTKNSVEVQEVLTEFEGTFAQRNCAKVFSSGDDCMGPLIFDTYLLAPEILSMAVYSMSGGAFYVSCNLVKDFVEAVKRVSPFSTVTIYAPKNARHGWRFECHSRGEFLFGALVAPKETPDTLASLFNLRKEAESVKSETA